MKKTFTISIKRRIYLSFLLLAGLFLLSVFITNLTLKKNRAMSERLAEVINPSLRSLDDFKKMLLESKMYTTNWVFLRYNDEDKESLKRIHDTEFAKLKERLTRHSSRWNIRHGVDTLNNIIEGFERLMKTEKEIMSGLDSFEDYDDPVQKLEAERKIEEIIIPGTATLMNSLQVIHDLGTDLRTKESLQLEKSSSRLRTFIISLGLATILVGLFLSVYLTRVIIAPLKKINAILNDLGKGIVSKVANNGNADEIGSMIRSVNTLSSGLKNTASFAHEVGMRNFEMPFKPLSDEDILGKALVTMRDNLKISETNLETQNKELERKNRELEQFAYVASHDLQEPLRTTSSFVKLFGEQYKGKFDERADQYLKYIADSSDRMTTLISDLLVYSRIGKRNEVQEIDCNNILNDVLGGMVETIHETQTEIQAATLPVIKGYPAEMKQLFQHLIFNAIKFRKKSVSPRIRVTCITNNDSWQFSFSDNGIGIPKEHHERIFIIFQRLHNRNEYKGSGIGLSHCKKIVELHKGRIWLDSDLGKGTTFHFTIPKDIVK